MKKLTAIFLVFSVLMLITPVVHAEGLIEKYPYVKALDLEYSDIKWIFATPDFIQMTYVGTMQIGNDNRDQLVNELRSIGPVKYLGPWKTRVGDIVIRTKANTRYSYHLESPSTLNINGTRYQVSAEQAQHIKNIIKMIEDYEYLDCYPQWFAWMNPANVTTFSQFQPLVSDKDFKRERFYSYEDERESFPSEIDFMVYHLFRDYFDIEKGERYELGSVELPKDQEYYEMTIGFKSGTSYKVMTHGSTMLLEATDMSYGCKYTLKAKNKPTSIREAYSQWTYRWAHPPDM